MDYYARHSKRWFDLAAAVAALLLFSPLFALLLAAQLAACRGRPFFFQPRTGKDGRRFVVIKFRTMNDQRDEAGHLLPDAHRLTGPGRFLRRTSLDELPQLINVLKGEMSIVGPRPLLEKYLPLYTPRQAQRHSVKPGITGWAQINGRNALDWEQKFEYDIWYVEHISLATDLRILALTFQKILSRQDISNPGHATMPEFKGTIKS